MATEPNTTEDQGLTPEATTDPPIEGVEGQAAAPPVAPPAPAITPEQFEQLMAQNAHLMQSNNQLMQHLATQAAPVSPAVPPMTDDQFQELADAGKGASAMRAVIAESQETAFGKRLENLEKTGVYSLERIAAAVGKQGLEHWDRFQKEIDVVLGQVDATTRTQPEVYKFAYDTVRGRHVEDLVKEGVEAELRKQASASVGDPTQTAGPGRATGGGGEDGVPTVEELCGKDAAISADQKGGPDAYAQTLGYADWKTYIKDTEWQDEWMEEYKT